MASSTSSDSPAKKSNLPWSEKYRPKTVDEVSHQEEVVRTLKSSIKSGNLPHLLFYGPPGTGKTSTILAIAKDLYGPTMFKTRVLELNASDERGINVVRTKIKTFAQGTVGTAGRDTGYPCPPYKIIILDEADSMTAAAQAALRRIMETYSAVTRFCLVCNYVSRIIDPLASRCSKFRFKPLSVDAMTHRLGEICRDEGALADAVVLKTLVKVSGGDMRKSINFLQLASQLCNNSLAEADGAPGMIRELAGLPPASLTEAVWSAVRSGQFKRLEETVESVRCDAMSVASILHVLHEECVEDATISDLAKAAICIKLGEADKALIDGADEHLQFLDVLATAQRAMR